MSEEANQRFQFALLKYECDRAHELELDKVTAQIEIAFIQAAVILNGVAATAFLSFAGSNLKELPRETIRDSLIFWSAGLLAGLIAGFIAYRAQGNFVRASRNRRHALGIAVFGRVDPLILGLLPNETVEGVEAEGAKRQKRGTWQWWVVNLFGLASIALLFAGILTAALGDLRA